VHLPGNGCKCGKIQKTLNSESFRKQASNVQRPTLNTREREQALNWRSRYDYEQEHEQDDKA
jgi:hypothetical protein